MARALIALLTLLTFLGDVAFVLAQTPPAAGTPAPAVGPPPAGGAAPPAKPGAPGQPGAPAKPGQAAKPPEPPAPDPVFRKVFRWVDKDGVLNYSDTAPQPDAVPAATPAASPKSAPSKDQKK
jgi:hypothetical protein